VSEVNPLVPTLSDETWDWLCASSAVRDDVVAATRARLRDEELPDALAVADAILARCPTLLTGIC
jgi:hypothetical protein